MTTTPTPAPTDTSREAIERLAKSVQYSQGITGSNKILALLAALDAAERERDKLESAVRKLERDLTEWKSYRTPGVQD